MPALVLIAAFGLSAVLALGLTPLARRIAPALGAMDLPSDRKMHSQPVPRLGGAAVVAAILLATVLVAVLTPGREPFGNNGFQSWFLVGLAALVVFAVGFVDDIRPISARFKFAVEAVAALVVVTVAELPSSVDLSPFGRTVELGPLMIVAAAFWIVAVTNAFNMIDGMDGLAAGVGGIAAAALAGACALLGDLSWCVVLMATAGSFGGFLPYNARPARIFLGDGGSLGVGFLLGAASIFALQRDGAWLVFPASLALGLPLADCCFAVLRRAWQAVDVVRVNGRRERYAFSQNGGMHLFRPDRRHLHHRLLDLRFTVGGSLVVLYGVAVALGAIAIATVRIPWIGLVAGFLGLAGCAYFAPRWLYQELRLVDRGTLLPVFEHRALKKRWVHVLFDGFAAAGSYATAQALLTEVGVHAGPLGGVDIVLVAGSVVAGLWMTGVYGITFRHASLSEVLRIVRGVVFGTVLACGVRYFVIEGGPSIAVWMLCFYLTATFVVGARVCFRVQDHLYQRARSRGTRALIYGAGRAGDLALREILSNPELGIRPVGFVDDERTLWGRSYAGYTVYPGGSALEERLVTEQVQQVVLASKKFTPARLQEIEDVCGRCGVGVVRFDLTWQANGTQRVEQVSGSTVIDLVDGELPPGKGAAGRLESPVDA